jgi:ankyrin repeat protein
MSAIRLIVVRIFIIVTVTLGTGKLYGQWELADSLRSSDRIIDTSDYIPFFTKGALDYNLMIAASKGYNSEIDRLIYEGADINAESDEGATPLIFAVSNNRVEAVKTLLSYDPILYSLKKSVESPLLIAVKNRNFEIAEALIRAGADVNSRDKHLATPLHYASLYGYPDIVDLLLYYDADPDLKSAEGTSPLLAAIWAGNTDVADLLIQRGADLEEKDNDGFTPFLLASAFSDTLMMDILYKKGADIYAINNAHHNALSLSISTGNRYATDFLLKIGNKWAEKSKNAIDPYTVAAKYQRTGIINTLKENNIPGQLKYKIDQIGFSLSTRLFIHDIYTGLSLSFKEPYLNAGFIIGCDTKLWYSRLLIKKSESLYYQYMDKGSLGYAGIFKDFVLTDYPGKFNYSFSASLMAGYSFGNKLKGTSMTTDNNLKVVPGVVLKITKLYLTIDLGVEYVKTEFYHDGPVWLRLGATYNYFFDNMRTKLKPIRWN